MQQYYVIGDPIAHSLSPVIYRFLFEKYGIDAAYDARRVTADSLPSFIESVRNSDVRGFNITMPLKKDVEAYLVWKAPDARFGVNTVCVRQDGLHGYSTDAEGFRTSLMMHGVRYEDSRVVFIGCGGAGQALIFDALEQHAEHVTIINRTPARAEQFAGLPRVAVRPFDQLNAACEECDILINATPLGMHGVSAQFEDFTFFGVLPQNAFVADLIYNPPETRFLKEARQSGHRCMNGLGMLTWQGLLAFEKYTGIMPTKDDADAVQKRLEAVLTAP